MDHSDDICHPEITINENGDECFSLFHRISTSPFYCFESCFGVDPKELCVEFAPPQVPPSLDSPPPPRRLSSHPLDPGPPIGGGVATTPITTCSFCQGIGHRTASAKACPLNPSRIKGDPIMLARHKLIVSRNRNESKLRWWNNNRRGQRHKIGRRRAAAKTGTTKRARSTHNK